MSGHGHNNKSGEVRVELKYCEHCGEHCGGLWVRERGAGVVYCEKCQGQLEEMPMRKKNRGGFDCLWGPSASMGLSLRKKRRTSMRWEGWHEGND